MKFPALAVAFALFSGAPAGAQVDDPLYPLDVGAEWEFEVQYTYPTGATNYMVYRERREVTGDTLLAGEAFRIVRVLRAPGDAVSWTLSARCAVRVDRSLETPAIDWVAITGECAPLEQGMALSDIETGSFSVTVVGDTVSFSRGIRNVPGSTGSWALVEGVGPHAMFVYNSTYPVPRYETIRMTYVNVGDVDAGREYQPGWWHYLVRLNEGDRYQYEWYGANVGPDRFTFEEWIVLGDTAVGGTPMVLIEQREFWQDGGELARQSLCGVIKGTAGVTVTTLQGGACRGIRVDGIWWFNNLREVETLGLTRPGSYNYSGPYNNYTLSEFAEGIGYTLYKRIYSQGSMGSHYAHILTLRYAEIDGVTYGSPVVSGEPGPTQSGRELYVYPNPFEGALGVVLAGSGPSIASVEVFDIMGRRVLDTSMATPGRQEFDLASLPPGVYMVRASLDDGFVVTRRVTKVR